MKEDEQANITSSASKHDKNYMTRKGGRVVKKEERKGSERNGQYKERKLMKCQTSGSGVK